MQGFRKFGGPAQAIQVFVLIAFALFASSAYSASKTMLVLGDSLSAEYGLTRGTGWVPLLQKRLQEKKIDVMLANASISGETSSGGKARVQSLLDKHHPDIVIIELGSNDALRGLSLKATETNLRAVMAASRKAHAKILLIGMQIPPNYGADYTKKFSTLFPKLASEYKTALVPFLMQDMVNKPELFQADRIHPTAEAQPILLDTVWPHLVPLLSPQSKK